MLVLVRNSMLIGLGLGFDDPATDRAELTMYRTMLMRAAALALCDAVGVERPDEAAVRGRSAPSDELRSRGPRLARPARRRSSRRSPTASPVAGPTAWPVSSAWSTTGSASAPTATAASSTELTHLLGRRPDSVADGLAEVARARR